MERIELENYIWDEYGVTAEYLWEKSPSFAVFRHDSNNKWFAVLMRIDKRKLGILEDGEIDVLNVKRSPSLFLQTYEKGIFPAYHMNKEHWISISIKESDSEQLKFLLSLSYELTEKKTKKR